MITDLNLTTHDQLMALLSCVVAGICGFVLGWERQSREKAAGIRTHVLVSLGSCLFTLASVDMSLMGMMQYFQLHPDVAGSSGPLPDPGRIAAQVVSGIGFLGGGVILRNSDKVKGLTTASTIWLCAAIGMLCGIQAYWLAIPGTVLAIVFLSLGRYASHMLKATMYNWSINLTIHDDEVDIRQMKAAILDVIEHKRNINVINHYREDQTIKILINYTGSSADLTNIIRQMIPPTIEHHLDIHTIPKLEYHDEFFGGYDDSD